MLWNTTFSSASLEQEYQTELVTEKIRLTRILAVLGITLNLSFVVLDFWAIPSSLAAVWSLRGAIVSALALAFFSTRLAAFPRWYNNVIMLTFAVMGAGVNGMIFLAQPGDAAIDQYFGGLLLIIIGLHTLTYVTPWLALLMSLSLLAAYAAIAVFGHGYLAGAERVILLANLFVGLSAAIIGMVAQSLRDRYSRENYLLRHSLQREVAIKDEESRRAAYLAEHDALTGLANRLCFEQEAGALIEQAARNDTWVAVMFIDLDSLKPINDGHGHAVGDRVLRSVAERLRTRLRVDDSCARLGGDEFAVATAIAAGDSQAIRVTAQRLAAAIADGIDLRGQHLELTASIGVAVYPLDGLDLETVLQAADRQMYLVKHQGKAGIGMTPACETFSAAPANASRA